MKKIRSWMPFALVLAGSVATTANAGTGIPSNCRGVDGTIDWDCVCLVVSREWRCTLQL